MKTIFLIVITIMASSFNLVLANESSKEKYDILEDSVKKYSSARITITKENAQVAQDLAKNLLELSLKYKNDWNYGNAIHHGNLLLGRIALFNGDIKDAEKYLILASKTKGSPQLNSFGPNMNLAKELLEKGKKEVVVNYIDNCLKFWTEGPDTEILTSTWKRIINEGSIPDFKGNLVY